MTTNIRWAVIDRQGYQIYLTEERWYHIVEPANHPEMADYENELQQTLQSARRKQDPINPQKYYYTQSFAHLDEDNTHIVAVVLFRYSENEQGRPMPNNYVVTAYQKEIG